MSTTEHAPIADPNRFVRFWYLHEFLHGFVLLYPVYAIFMLDLGLSPLELSWLFIIWSGSTMAFELPTGVLADRFPRRNILIMAGVIKAAAFGIWWLIPDFGGFAAGFVIWAFAGANISGASEAYIHDQLAMTDRTELFERVYGRGSAFEQAGIITALAAGGAIADVGFDLVFSASILTCLAAAVVALIGFPQGRVMTQPKHRAQTFFASLVEGTRVSLTNRAVALAIAMLSLLSLAPETLDEYLGPLLDEPGAFSVTSIGFLYAALSVLLQGFLQRRVADQARATIGSIASLALNGFALPMYGAIGVIAASHGFAGAFTMAGIFTVVVGSVLLLITTRTR